MRISDWSSDVCSSDLKNFPIDTQLLIAADTITVGGNQCQLAGTVPHHAARGKLCGGGGLADAGGTYQCVDATFFQNFVFVSDGCQIAHENGFDPFHAAFCGDRKSVV